MRGRYLRGMCACILILGLGSCRAFEASRCSAPEIVDTVKSLSMGGDNPLAVALFQAIKPTVSLDAIRTTSSGSSETLCEGRLTISAQVIARTPQEGSSPSQTAGNPVEQEHSTPEFSTNRTVVTYKLERSDDGRTYVTIIPSQADILERQNRQQRYQEQEYQQQQENRAEEQRQIDRQQQYEDNLEERWRQHD